MSPDRFPWVEAVEQLYGVQTSLLLVSAALAHLILRRSEQQSADASVIGPTYWLGS